MAIDIRANVTCNLGTLISAEISDDYVQGTGLIKAGGSCVIKGLISPPPGLPVTFQYTKSGITRTIPRKLRVLSSFADPFRNTTTVQLGCKLTYFQDLKERISWTFTDDPENEDVEESESEIVIFPISAQSVANECLLKLGIAAIGLLLTNKFSIASFDFSSGYVSVLSDLLVSECLCGYLDLNENLRIFSLSASGGSGPIIGQNEIIDIGQIGVGDLPGDSVTVSYSTLKLKAPDDVEVRCSNTQGTVDPSAIDIASGWGTDGSSSYTKSEVVIAYDLNGETTNAVFDASGSNYSETQYRQITVTNEDGTPEKRNVVSQRITRETKKAASVAGGYVTQRLSAGLGFGNYDVTVETIEKFSYDSKGNEVYRSSKKTGSAIYGVGALGLQMVFPPGAPTEFEPEPGAIAIPLPSFRIMLEEIITTTYVNGDYRWVGTRRYGPWHETISGQQSIAEAREALNTAGKVSEYISAALGGRFLLDASVSTERTGSRPIAEEAPSQEDLLAEELADKNEGDPNNGFRVESTSEIEFAVGGPISSERRIELSMPYAPDDFFRRVIEDAGPPTVYCYYSKTSDAKAKAANFGRAQNRILLGNRNGMNIQTTPEKIPDVPFSPIYVNINGLTVMYRTNGTNWTIDNSGIIGSTDALYWGVVGKS